MRLSASSSEVIEWRTIEPRGIWENKIHELRPAGLKKQRESLKNAVKQRQAEVNSEYRKKADKLDAEYHQHGDATTFKSILNEYGKGGEVLGLVVGYSGEASSDVHRVADLVATRLASKHLDYVRTSKSIAKAMQTQRICRAWGHSFARGFARVIVDRVRDNLDQAPGSRNWGSELDADAEFNFFYPPSAGRGRS
jgi:transcription initiation factor TFIIIB Brf1 subunit/transcription initiation factor TFIIB